MNDRTVPFMHYNLHVNAVKMISPGKKMLEEKGIFNAEVESEHCGRENKPSMRQMVR